MNRGAWQATVHGVARVGHHLATKLPTLTLKPTYSKLAFPCHLTEAILALLKVIPSHQENQ